MDESSDNISPIANGPKRHFARRRQLEIDFEPVTQSSLAITARRVECPGALALPHNGRNHRQAVPCVLRLA